MREIVWERGLRNLQISKPSTENMNNNISFHYLIKLAKIIGYAFITFTLMFKIKKIM